MTQHSAVRSQSLHARLGTYFCAVPAMEPALHFFRDALGCPVHHDGCRCGVTSPSDEQLAAHTWLQFDAGIQLWAHVDPTLAPRDLGVGLWIDDCDVARGVLRQHGIETLQAPQRIAEGVRGFEIKDPFGNTWWIYGA